MQVLMRFHSHKYNEIILLVRIISIVFIINEICLSEILQILLKVELKSLQLY
jgi:hypothetical protein